MQETREHQLKRLRMRSWRRGIKEMDLILGPYSDTSLAALSTDQIEKYEALLDENDQELYAWFSGRELAPEHHRSIIETIMDGRSLR